MGQFMRLTIAAMCIASTLIAPAAQAGPWDRGGYGHREGWSRHGENRHEPRRRGRNVAGAVAAGAALGLIGGAIIASQAQREREQAQREREAAYAYGRRAPSPYGY